MSVRKRYGAPEATTQGNVGDLYVDLDTGKVYRCVDVATYGDSSTDCTVYVNRGEKNTVYIWKSTGASSWNELEDKPFYEETTTVNEPLNITWYGDTEGLVSVEDIFYKVSDSVLTDEQINCITVTMSNGECFEIADEWDRMVDEGFVNEDVVVCPGGIVLFVRKNNSEVHSMFFPESGIYLIKNGGLPYVTSLTTTEPVEHTKTVVKKLDKKYLPSGSTTFYIFADERYVYVDPDGDVQAHSNDIANAMGKGAVYFDCYNNGTKSLSSLFVITPGAVAGMWISVVYDIRDNAMPHVIAVGTSDHDGGAS